MPWLVSLGSGLLVFLNTYGIVSTPVSDGSFMRLITLQTTPELYCC